VSGTVVVNCCARVNVSCAALGTTVPVPFAVPTTTVTEAAGPAPLALLQVRVYVVVAVSAAVGLVPAAVCAPLQPPDAVQDVALVEVQVSVVPAPGATPFGVAVRVAVGTIFTVADEFGLVPPAPVHDNT
jgi:hypothetical protein